MFDLTDRLFSMDGTNHLTSPFYAADVSQAIIEGKGGKSNTSLCG